MPITEEYLMPVYIGLYRKYNTKEMLFSLCDLPVSSFVILRIYKWLLDSGDLKPIESLQDSEKRELIKECTGASDIIKACKILHVLKYYLKK